LVAVVYFRSGRAKNLSALPRTFKKKLHICTSWLPEVITMRSTTENRRDISFQ